MKMASQYGSFPGRSYHQTCIKPRSDLHKNVNTNNFLNNFLLKFPWTKTDNITCVLRPGQIRRFGPVLLAICHLCPFQSKIIVPVIVYAKICIK